MMNLEPPRSKARVGELPEVEAWRSLGISRSGMERFLHVAQAAVGLRGEVSVLLSGDSMLRRLNREFRGKNQPTDVLSFPAVRTGSSSHAGDVAISLDRAKCQAHAYRHSLRDEVRILLLHGLLHLAGMDHETDQGEMAARENMLRKRFRLPTGLIARAGKATEKSPIHAKRHKGRRGEAA